MPRRPRLTLPLLVGLIVWVAFVLRVLPLEAQSLWRDEVDALCYAFQFPHALFAALAPGAATPLVTPCACPPSPVAGAGLAGTLGAMVRNNGPLYYFLLRGWIGLAGTSVTALRYFSALFGVLAVPLTYALGRRLLGRPASLFAAILTAASPYLTWYSQEVKMYSLVPALALLAIYGLRRAVDGGGWRWWAVQVGATTLALYTHIWCALLIPVQAWLFLVWWPRARAHWRGGLVSLALLTLPYAPLAAWELPNLLVSRETGFPHLTAWQMAGELLSGWSVGLGGWGWAWGEWGRALALAACGGAALLGVLVGPGGTGRAEKWRTRAGLLGWLLLPLAGIWLVSLRQPLFTDRYLIWTAPAFYLLAAAGLAWLWRHGRWPALPLLAAILTLFAGSQQAQVSVPLRSDFRAAAAFVEQHYREGDLLLFQIPHGRYTFDYYFAPTEYAAADGPYTNYPAADGEYLLSPQQVALQMGRLVQGHERVWLVATEMEMWDRRLLTQGWLEENRVRALEGYFRYVGVFLYVTR